MKHCLIISGGNSVELESNIEYWLESGAEVSINVSHVSYAINNGVHRALIIFDNLDEEN